MRASSKKRNNMRVKQLTNKTRISLLLMPKPCLESTHKRCLYFFLFLIHPYQNAFPSMPRGPLLSPYRTDIGFSMLIFRLSNKQAVDGQPHTSLLRWESKLQFFLLLPPPLAHASTSQDSFGPGVLLCDVSLVICGPLVASPRLRAFVPEDLVRYGM